MNYEGTKSDNLSEKWRPSYSSSLTKQSSKLLKASMKAFKLLRAVFHIWNPKLKYSSKKVMLISQAQEIPD